MTTKNPANPLPTSSAHRRSPRINAAQARVLAAVAHDGYTLYEEALENRGVLVKVTDARTERITVSAALLTALKDRGYLEEESDMGRYSRYAAHYRMTYLGHVALQLYTRQRSGKPTNARAYALLLATSREVGWPEYYRTDLTLHDRETLTYPDAPQVFGWRLSSTGTDLFAAGRRGALLQAEVCQDPASRWYWYEDDTLEEVSCSIVAARLRSALDATEAEQAE